MSTRKLNQGAGARKGIFGYENAIYISIVECYNKSYLKLF